MRENNQQESLNIIPNYAKPVIQNVVGTMNLGCQL